MFHEFRVPSRHSSVVISWVLPEEQVGVIRADDNFEFCLFEEVCYVPSMLDYDTMTK